MNLRRFLAALAALGCVCALAGSTATAAGEEIVVETVQLNPANPTQWIDYSVANTQAAWLINSVTCLKLLDYDEVTGALVPEAATAMPSVSADGLTYTFTVRAGQAFSGGPAEPVSAESFKRAIERATSPAMAASISPATPPARGIVAGIDGSSAFYGGTGPFSGIQASGNTLTIQLSARDATLPYRIAMPYFCATRADAPAGYTGTTAPAPHSGGPYFVSFANASGTQPNLQHEIVLLRNTAYSGNRLRNLGTIRVVQHGSALAEDHVHAAPAGFTGGPGVSVVPNVTTGIQLMALNTSKAPFDTESMRQAAAHAVDRTSLSNTAGAGWQPTDQFVSPLLPGYADANVYSLSANPAAATALLNGATPSVTLCHPTGPRAQVAAAAETQLEAVGFQVTLVQPPGNYFAYIANPANCHLAMLQMLPDFPDGSRILHNLFRSPTNPSFFDDPAFNARFDAAAGLTPESTRLAEVADIDRDMADAAVSIAIGHDRRHDAFASRIGCRFFSQVHFGYALNRLCISVEQSPGPGGTASTGEDATSAAPLQTEVTVPSGGAVTITQGQSSTTVPPEYQLLEQQLDISAPAQTPPDFLTFTFELDASLLAAAGLTVAEVAILRNGVGIPDCTDPGATPDPCIVSRTTQGDGDGEIVARSSQASKWEFGERYDVSGGFVGSVDDIPVVNTVGAGRTIPARFSLGGNEGLEILAQGSPTSAQVACPGSAPTDAVEETTSETGGGLTFDPATGVYQYNWKTAKSWAGTCRRLTIGLREGSQLQALFKFR